jgi:hypothetical protein
MVPYLGAVVKDPTTGFTDDIFQGRIFIFRPYDQLIEIGYISLVMLPIMEFNRPL